jgi:signal transduction histidine kinase
VVDSVNRIEAYDYTKRVEVKTIPNEIKKLVDTFNKLLVRHQESFSKISQFSSHASHELKTPLTSMRGEMEVGLRRERTPQEYQQILQKNLLKIIEIQELVDGLLFLAKSDKLEITSSFEEVYIDEIITECKEELKSMAHTKSIDMTMHLLPLTVKGDSKLLKIACINILKNAILYSPQKTEITISMEERGLAFVVIFEDQGVGIPKEDREYIFDRFYRVEKQKSQEDRGTGLGLSIVKMILDIHGFDILIESEIGRGTTVEIFIR